MPTFVTKLVMLVKRCSIIAVALVLPFAIGAEPARAQGLFGFLKALFQPVPTYTPFEYRPGSERPKAKVRRHPKPAEQAAIRKPIEPKAPGEAMNPVPALLADSTLRPGDMVMFPDGLRVFTGQPGNQHELDDFEPISQAGKAVSRTTRKLVANLRPGANTAWNAAGLKSGGNLAANVEDVATTGSVKRTDSRGGSRPR